MDPWCPLASWPNQINELQVQRETLSRKQKSTVIEEDTGGQSPVSRCTQHMANECILKQEGVVILFSSLHFSTHSNKAKCKMQHGNLGCEKWLNLINLESKERDRKGAASPHPLQDCTLSGLAACGFQILAQIGIKPIAIYFWTVFT